MGRKKLKRKAIVTEQQQKEGGGFLAGVRASSDLFYRLQKKRKLSPSRSALPIATDSDTGSNIQLLDAKEKKILCD
ncbi:unnamed protein product [Gadus morhua 'NCC']